MALGGIQAWIFSFNPLNGWMDNLRFYGVFFFFLFFSSYIIPVILGRWEEDNIKLCAVEPLLDLYMSFMYQVRRRYLVCAFGGRGGSGL